MFKVCQKKATRFHFRSKLYPNVCLRMVILYVFKRAISYEYACSKNVHVYSAHKHPHSLDLTIYFCRISVKYF